MRFVTPNGVRLGAWLAYQRRKYAAGELREDRIRQLNAVGMEW